MSTVTSAPRANVSAASPLPAKPRPAMDDESVRPFRINIPDEALADLRRRIATTRWPDKETVADQSQLEYQEGIAYGYQMGLRPQTLYGIADSPVGLAAYFLDHDARSYELIARL